MTFMTSPRLLLLLVVAAAALLTTCHAQGDMVIFEAPPAEAVEKGKQALDKWSAQAATERGLVNVLLGNSCFTTAITALNTECSQLTNEQRCWLAIQFTMCFQRASGFKVLACPTVCPKRRSLQSCVEECTGTMDDRQTLTYTQFFGDVLNMCLFLQTQNFQQVTAALVTDMHASSTAANASLSAIRSDLQSQSKALTKSLSALTKLQAVQSEVEAAVQAGLQEVKAVGVMSQGLQQSMDKSLNMTGMLSSRHEQLMLGFTELESAHQQHAERAKQAFEQLAQEAAALEHRQARYEALQTRLLNASESLLDQSQDMNDLLKLLMHYQAKGNTILTQLQGTSISLHDVLFYTLALCVPLVFITYPSDVRILLLAGVLACWGVERFVLQHWVMLFGPLRAGQTGSFGGNFSGGHDVKITVRLFILGGTLGVVVWLLLKRRAAHNRREAIFQAIQASLQQAHFNHAAAFHPAAAAHAPNPAAAAHARTHAQQLVPYAEPQHGPKTSKKAAAAAAAAAAASHASLLSAQQPLLHPGVLMPAARQQYPTGPAAAPTLHMPHTPTVQGSRGWLAPLFGAGQAQNPLPHVTPDQLMGWMHHTGPAVGPAGYAAPTQQLLMHSQHPASVQHHVTVPSQPQAQHTQHIQHMQPAQPQDSGAGADGPGPSGASAEGIEESVGTGAGNDAAAAQKLRRGSRSGAGEAPAAKQSAMKTPAGRKRSAATAAAAEGSCMEGSGVTEDPAGPAASKHGRAKRKK